MCIGNRLKQLQLPEPIAVIGGGVTGLSCFNVLRLAGIDCHIFDESDSVPPLFSEHGDKVMLGAFGVDQFDAYQTILLSPGVDMRRDCFAKNSAKLLTDIELFARLTHKPVVGVTGSNGKSTVVSLLHQVTQLNDQSYVLCGNIGLPVLEALVENEAHCDGYIVELSSYHLERSPSLKLVIGAWLNVSPDHLDRYDDYDNYVATKSRIFACSKHIVANAEDRHVRTYARLINKPITWFSKTGQSADYYLSGTLIQHGNQSVFDMNDFAQIGNHHSENVMAVFAMAERLGISQAVTAQACRDFTPLASRCVVVGEKDGVTFINDSKGTNIGATAAAISGMKQPIVLIAGGQGKGQDFNELAQAARGRVKVFELIGIDAQSMKESLHKAAPCVLHNSLDSAVRAAIDAAQPGDVVMLSPACASLDMFVNYLKRGEAFEALVKEWTNE